MLFIISGQSQCQEGCITRTPGGNPGPVSIASSRRVCQSHGVRLPIFKKIFYPSLLLARVFRALQVQHQGCQHRLGSFNLVLILLFAPGEWNRQQPCWVVKCEASPCKVRDHRRKEASVPKARIIFWSWKCLFALFICY